MHLRHRELGYLLDHRLQRLCRACTSCLASDAFACRLGLICRIILLQIPQIDCAGRLSRSLNALQLTIACGSCQVGLAVVTCKDVIQRNGLTVAVLSAVDEALHIQPVDVSTLQLALQQCSHRGGGRRGYRATTSVGLRRAY